MTTTQESAAVIVDIERDLLALMRQHKATCQKLAKAKLQLDAIRELAFRHDGHPLSRAVLAVIESHNG